MQTSAKFEGRVTLKNDDNKHIVMFYLKGSPRDSLEVSRLGLFVSKPCLANSLSTKCSDVRRQLYIFSNKGSEPCSGLPTKYSAFANSCPMYTNTFLFCIIINSHQFELSSNKL